MHTHSPYPYSAHQGEVTSLSFAPSDAKFVSSSDDKTLKLWDFARHEEEGSLQGHTWCVSVLSVCVSTVHACRQTRERLSVPAYIHACM